MSAITIVVLPAGGCPVCPTIATTIRCGRPLSLNEWDQPCCPVHGVLQLQTRPYKPADAVPATARGPEPESPSPAGAPAKGAQS